MKPDHSRQNGCPWYVRIAARIVARRIANRPSDAWQVFSAKPVRSVAGIYEAYMPKEQFIHWILHECGWAVTVNDIVRRYRLGVQP